MKLEELMPLYLQEQQPTPTVLAMVRLSWPKFVRFCACQRLCQVDEITPTVLEDFYKKLLWEANEKGQFYKANSVDQFVRRTRQVLRWGAAHGLLKIDPTVGLLLPRPLQPVPQRLTWKQLQNLLNTPDRSTPLGLRDALLVQLLAEADLPLMQLVTLTEDTMRQLDLQATTWTLLADYLEHGRPSLAQGCSHTALFLGRGGDPLGSQAAAIRLNEMAKQAGLGRRLPSRILRQSYQAALQKLQERHPME